MNSSKKTARIVGALFITATVAFMLGNGLIESILNAPDYLVDVYPNKTQVILGILLELINSAAVVGIAVVLFPILKKHNETIALGYVGFRVLESAILIVGAIIPVLLITLSQEYIKAGTPDTSYFQTLGTLAIEGHQLAFQVAMIVLGVYSLMFCYLLYQSKLIPRFISGLGFIGYASLLISALLEIFGNSTGMILYLPGALFEIILPIWLIVKGFNSSAIDSQSTKTGIAVPNY
jgi:Domain of unknown function (DUF4386)